MRSTATIAAIAGAFLVQACTVAQSPAPPTYGAACPAPAGSALTDAGTASGSASAASASGDNGPKAAAQVTFYGDLLPVLSVNEKGRVYKCTTCHAHYGKPEGLNNVAEIDSIVKSLETGYMPRAGDRMPAEAIALFKTWQLQGFQTGAAPVADVPTGGSGGADQVQAAAACP